MAPQFYEVDVWAGTRKLSDQTLRVVIDWREQAAEHTRRQLNALLAAVAAENRAVAPDLREYRLLAWPVDERGRREGGRDPQWTWRWLPDQEDPSWR